MKYILKESADIEKMVETLNDADDCDIECGGCHGMFPKAGAFKVDSKWYCRDCNEMLRKNPDISVADIAKVVGDKSKSDEEKAKILAEKECANVAVINHTEDELDVLDEGKIDPAPAEHDSQNPEAADIKKDVKDFVDNDVLRQGEPSETDEDQLTEGIRDFDDFDTEIQSDELIPAEWSDDFDPFDLDFDVDEADDIVVCGWCGEDVPVTDCKKEASLGHLCPYCQAELKSRGEKLIFID